jgi:hypothetical protein
MHIRILYFFLLVQDNIFAQENSAINPPSLQDIVFKKNSSKLTRENKATLDSIIILSKRFSEFTLIPEFFFSCKPKSNKIINDRLTAVVDYLLLNGIDTNKLYLGFSHMKRAEIITFRFDTISLPEAPLPHPNTRKTETMKTENQ